MNKMSSKVVAIFFLVCVGVSLQMTEGSRFLHPYYRFHSFWPDFNTFEDDFFSDPFFREPFEWDPFRDDTFLMDFPVFRKPAISRNPRHCLLKTTAKSSVKPLEQLQLSVDVKGFAPQELTLVTKGNDVIVKGEKKVCDSTSCYTRSLCWRKKLPQGVKMETVKAKLTKDNTVEITAEKRKESTEESDANTERETREKLTLQNLENQEQAKSAKPSDLPLKNQNTIKEDIPKPVTEQQATKDEVEEETTLEVVNDEE